MNEVPSGEYLHFKGHKNKDRRYNVIGVAENTETGELLVVYQPLYGEHKYKICVRPLENFVEHVDRPDFEYEGPRFYPIYLYPPVILGSTTS